MSEITRGAIGMPFDMAMSSELSRRQFHQIAQALLVERDQLKAENEALRKALSTIRDESSDLGACECAADALTDSRKEVGHE